MIVSAINFVTQDHCDLETLIDPDNVNEWAVRYLWIQHRTENSEFVANYFTNGNSRGLNVRKRTQHLGESWRNHNRVFDESAANGNLVWRVKSYNCRSQSIDYIEIWRSQEILTGIFDKPAVLLDGNQWTDTEKSDLGRGIYDSGFDVRHLRPFAGISRKLAIEYYWKFVERNQAQDNCIINTQYNKILNPYES
jgi:transposase-like protein